MLQLNWNLLYEIINLIVLCLLLKKFLIGPVIGVMEKRRVLIEEGLANARVSEAQAGELKSRYEEALQNAKLESVHMVDEAKKRAQAEYERILREAGSEASEVRKRADKEIEAEKAKAMQDLKSRIAEVALLISQKVAGGADCTASGEADRTASREADRTASRETDRTSADLSIYEQFLEESLKESGESYDECFR